MGATMLKTIQRLDKIIIHLYKEQILIAFSDFDNPVTTLEELFRSGDIFEVEGLVYPIDSKHDFNYLKTEFINEDGEV